MMRRFEVAGSDGCLTVVKNKHMCCTSITYVCIVHPPDDKIDMTIWNIEAGIKIYAAMTTSGFDVYIYIYIIYI